MDNVIKSVRAAAGGRELSDFLTVTPTNDTIHTDKFYFL